MFHARADRSAQPVKPQCVLSQDVVACACRQLFQRSSYLAHHAWISAVEVRVVRTPQHVALDAQINHRLERALVRVHRDVARMDSHCEKMGTYVPWLKRKFLEGWLAWRGKKKSK